MSAIHIPNINQRRRIPAQAIDDIVRQIAGKFKPEKIILFGSYARHQPRPESDVDLLITPSNLARRLELGDPFLQEIIVESVTLYESVAS